MKFAVLHTRPICAVFDIGDSQAIVINTEKQQVRGRYCGTVFSGVVIADDGVDPDSAAYMLGRVRLIHA